MAANNTANVSFGKGVAGGYMWVAPSGTTLPTDYTIKMSEVASGAYQNVGYLGEDGIVISDSFDQTTASDMNGNAVATAPGAVEKSFTVTPIEINKTALGLVYGDSNVTDATGKLTAHDKGPTTQTKVAVFDLLLKDDRPLRLVAPLCNLGELGDLTINFSELVGREVTMSVLKYTGEGTSSGDYWTWYTTSNETEG